MLEKTKQFNANLMSSLQVFGRSVHQTPTVLKTAGVAEEGDKTDFIKIKVVGQDSNEIHFQVKFSTSMGKLKKSYAERTGVAVSSLRHVFSGLK